ncbi:L,D-transpeptidase family protein [Streptomyces sp. NRRL S-87]|uniref:L,D-transpeptidase family protein n=1 Tax=Streptomyces sp. NRRL S-87 TaxID=1463920 RepID=UPI000A54AFAD|nr:L,D-transpeptidase family protein [Streptomyces sp. NRRL S-87]
MYRQKVFRAALVAAVAAAVVTGCGPQDSGAAGASGGSAGASSSPSQDDKGGATPSASESASPSGSASDSASPSASASASADKPLMAEGTENDQVRELQARLRQLDYFKRSPTGFYGSMTATAVKGFQTKRQLTATGSVDQKTWDKLLGMTHEPTADELTPPTTNELDKPDARCLTGRVMCISKESRTLAWMIDGKVQMAFDVRFGSENTPTREGLFNVEWKAKEWTSTLFHTPMPYAMFFSRGQAVHYSADFAARGYAGASHGCVNVRDKVKLSQLFDAVKVGDKVVVYW